MGRTDGANRAWKRHAAIRDRRSSCGDKSSYPDEAEAQRYARLFKSSYGAPIQGVYECRWCKGWHLTSKEK